MKITNNRTNVEFHLDYDECKQLLSCTRKSEEILQMEYDELNEFERSENKKWLKKRLDFLHRLIINIEKIVW